MNTYARAIVSLLVGGVGFLVGLVVATELLTPYVWPALLVSLPVALVAGVLAAGLTYGGLSYREQQARYGEPSPRTVAALGALVVGTAAFVVTAPVVAYALGFASVPLATALLFGGLPVGLIASAVGAAVGASYAGRSGTVAPR
ncbi:hypothetical protein DMJ13_07525 [halophilic archaeon]|nr:hypothetical protein DMJ13_07525 [halophilic archaeon]